MQLVVDIKREKIKLTKTKTPGRDQA